MEVFSAAPHQDMLLLVIRVGALLFAARLLGDLCQRVGQPAVLGELLAGLVLGPSVLGALSPALSFFLIPQTPVGGHLLGVVSLLGAMFLLLITGLETDIGLIRHHARTAFGVSAGGILITFSAALAVGLLLPRDLMSSDHPQFLCALFLALSVSIAAISVVAKVLMDLNLMRRDIGQTLIAAGLSDDIIGWIVFSIIAGVAASGKVDPLAVLEIIAEVLGFLVLSMTLGRRVVRRLLSFVQDHAVGRDPSLSLVVVLTFVWGAVTQALHIEAVLGAFVMGLLFGQMRRLPAVVHEQLESMALAVFAPIFFATAGLRVNLHHLREPRLLVVAAVLLVVAVGGKTVGAYLAARWVGGKDHWTALSFGAGLNARGGTDVIIASIGLQLGLLTPDLYSVVVLIAMLASFAAPTALRRILARVEPSEAELARLRSEELAKKSLVAGIHRVLMPVRPPADGDGVPGGLAHTRAVEAGLVKGLAAKQEIEATLMSVAPQGERAPAEGYLDQLRAQFNPTRPAVKVLESPQAAESIIAEANRQYDLVVLGASQGRASSEVVFNPIVDYLMRMAPCPTLVVKGGAREPHWPPSRILVRANGTEAARHAAEVAFALAGEQTEVILLHVVVQSSDTYYLDAGGRDLERQLAIGHQIVESMAEIGAATGVAADPEVRIGQAEDAVILDVIAQRHVDLLVVGTHLRPASERLYLGVRVERLLRESDCPVVVVNAV